MSFQISDKVVCVNDSEPKIGWSAYTDYLVKGKVYTIRNVRPGRGVDGTTMGCHVTGIEGIILSDGLEAGFVLSRFRKLEEIKEENRLNNQQPLEVLP